MEASGKFTPQELAGYYKFQLVADKDYLDRIQSTHKKFARIYPLFDSDIKYEIRGYTFPFTLYAPQPVQQYIYEHGLGHFSHKGFGMLDVANSESVKKAITSEVNYA
jgi:CRISPR-associated endoribonuclease Cas6